MATNKHKQKLDPQVWYPYFKFTLQTIGMTYPNKPNDATKKKYFTLTFIFISRRDTPYQFFDVDRYHWDKTRHRFK